MVAYCVLLLLVLVLETRPAVGARRVRGRRLNQRTLMADTIPINIKGWFFYPGMVVPGATAQIENNQPCFCCPSCREGKQ